MTLSWKDLVTTFLAVITASFAYFYIQGFQFPFVTGYRVASLVIVVLGIMMCAFGSGSNASPSMWINVANVLGILTVVVAIIAMIMGTKAIFLALVGIVLSLWLVATIRHLIGG